jgi:hypoxanthine phosphoribosyltransferase
MTSLHTFVSGMTTRRRCTDWNEKLWQQNLETELCPAVARSRCQIIRTATPGRLVSAERGGFTQARCAAAWLQVAPLASVTLYLYTRRGYIFKEGITLKL